VDTAGDGALTWFDSPARAITCAEAVRDGVRALGLQARPAPGRSWQSAAEDPPGTHGSRPPGPAVMMRRPARRAVRRPGNDRCVNFPKIELHVHLEGTVRAGTLLQIARRNGISLPADSVEGLAARYEFRDFAHFLEVWLLTTAVLRTGQDFRQVVVDYAAEAASHGAVYLEGIFTPAEPARRGADWDEVFTGYRDGAQQAAELHGVQVRLTPDVPRGYPLEAAELTAGYAVAYRDRGVVGLGLGGAEAQYPPEPYARAFAVARDGGLGSVPHAGEVAGPASIRGALDSLGADRIRHGIRSVDDPGLLAELADRGVVLDVCPVSNLRTGAVASLDGHPLPELVAAGVDCSVSTDDPAMFGTDLTADYAAAMHLGVSARDCYLAGLRGALCDQRTKNQLQQAGEAFDRAGLATAGQARGRWRVQMKVACGWGRTADWLMRTVQKLDKLHAYPSLGEAHGHLACLSSPRR
jgi:aminodeoxyfutalosine deaminase